MGDLIFEFLYYAFVIPGRPFATLLSKFIEIGDGTGNETHMIDFMIWSAFFGLVVWVVVIFGGIWAYNHMSISILVK